MDKPKRPKKFEDLNPSWLYFARPCKHAHAGPDGQGVRISKGYPMEGHCVACLYKLPDGPFTYQFVGDITPAREYLTPEESRARHIQQQMAYNARNAEAHKERCRKYWQNVSDEQREKRRINFEKARLARSQKVEERRRLKEEQEQRDNEELEKKILLKSKQIQKKKSKIVKTLKLDEEDTDEDEPVIIKKSKTKTVYIVNDDKPQKQQPVIPPTRRLYPQFV